MSKTAETGRRAAAMDVVTIVRLLTTGRLADVDVFMSTIDRPEAANVIIAFGGLCAALLQELDDTYLRHGEPAHAAAMLAALAAWDGSDGQHHE